MKKAFVAGLALVGISIVPALAADLPAKMYTKAAPAVPYAWTGFYVGVNGGCAWNRTRVDSAINDVDPGPDSFFAVDAQRQGGCFGGVQAGYNYQFSPNWVLGFEVDGQFGEETNRGTFLEVEGTPETLATYEQRMRHYGTARARIGYATAVPVLGQSLWYLTGGFAWARNKMDVASFEGTNGPQNFTDSKTLTGYAVGGGVEIAINRNWSWKAEYLYLDFGSHTYNGFVSDDGSPFSPVTATTKVHTARVGLNYKLY